MSVRTAEAQDSLRSPKRNSDSGLDGIGDPGRVLAVQDGAVRRP